MNQGQGDAVLTTLRKQLETAKNKIKQYQQLYINERQENGLARQLINQLQTRNTDLQTEKNNLHEQVQDLENHLQSFSFPKVYKKYNKLTSPLRKAKRRSLFKKCIEQSLIHIQEVKHATVKLRIGSKDVELFWSENELHNLRWIAQNIVGEGPGNEISDEHQSDSENEQYNDTDSDIGNNEADPFLSDGKWNPIHVRKIVHVLDMFHISLEAYHELRLASLSVLPPLYVVKIHKESMSWDINFNYNDKVSNFILIYTVADPG